jgi:hypothetical protein
MVGYVRMEFIEGEDNNDVVAKVLEKLPSMLEKLQDMGYPASDTGILVRSNHEGAQVLKRMTGYAAALKLKEGRHITTTYFKRFPYTFKFTCNKLYYLSAVSYQ